ncbi:MAG TPA: TetR/AcrR family transcriptional regulator, partial [Candidatus Lustribacter sp.]|nr:TetR/AcrR family transcriptional regulator [Candidatus Lustribacter sp.]
ATRLLRSPTGAQRCSLDAVAKTAGVTRLTVYNIFGSRSALFEAVFDERAKRGGLERIADAMGLSDPVASIDAVVALFVDFWAADRAVLGNLYALGTTDPELTNSLAARNERRRHLFSVLTQRLSAGGRIDSDSSPGLADVLFALTSYGFYADLAGRSRDADSVQPLIIAMAHDAVARFRLPTSN